MNGLPKDTDLTFLNGRMLLQLSVGLHELIFNFDGFVTISIEASLGLTPINGIEQIIDYPENIQTIIPLLHTSVIDSQRDDHGGLFLLFDNNSCLHLHNDSQGFESFMIVHKDTTIVA